MSITKVNDYEKELLHQIFEKIKRENGGITNNKAATLLEDQLARDYKYSITVRSLIRYYSKYVENKEVDCGIPKLELNNYLAKILNFEDYSEFVQALKNDKAETGTPVNEKKEISIPLNNLIIKNDKSSKLELVKNNVPYVVIIILIGLGIANFLYSNYNVNSNEKWMVWKIDHYEEFNNDLETLNFNSIKLVTYNKKALQNYRKIELNCEDSIKKVWYYKVNNHELDFFNFPGLHPMNGKTLKKLSYNMKKKYVCDKEIKKNE